MSFSKATDALLKSVNKVFGISATYTYLSSGLTSSIKGVFDNAFVEVNGIATKTPTFRIRLADLTAEPTDGDQILIGTVSYYIRLHEADSHGATILILERI